MAKILGYSLAVMVALVVIGLVFGEDVAGGIAGAIGGLLGLFGMLYVFGFGFRIRQK